MFSVVCCENYWSFDCYLDLILAHVWFFNLKQDDVKILLQDAMTSKSQVPQIPAKRPVATTTSQQVTSGGASNSAVTSASTTAQLQSCMMQPSAANQSLLKANPIGGASDAVSNVRSQVEAEGIIIVKLPLQFAAYNY